MFAFLAICCTKHSVLMLFEFHVPSFCPLLSENSLSMNSELFHVLLTSMRWRSFLLCAPSPFTLAPQKLLIFPLLSLPLPAFLPFSVKALLPPAPSAEDEAKREELLAKIGDFRSTQVAMPH